jgi:hypothetical protein
MGNGRKDKLIRQKTGSLPNFDTNDFAVANAYFPRSIYIFGQMQNAFREWGRN